MITTYQLDKEMDYKMKAKFTLAIIAIAASSLCHAAEFKFSERGERWTGDDKKKHAIGSAILGFGAGLTFEDKRVAFGAALAVGLAKEIKDATAKTGTGFSYKDMAANVAGAAVGVYAGNCLVRLQSVTCGWEF